MRVDQELIMKAADTATRAPHEWAALMIALRNYSAARAQECVASSAEQLQRMQGRAQQCASLSDLFEGAVKTANSITKNTAGKRS